MKLCRVGFCALSMVSILSCGRSVDRMGPRDLSPRPAPEMPVLPPEFQGGSVGNGGDDIPGQADSAWFLGRRQIKICLEISSDFGVSRSEAEAAVTGALGAWASYIDQRQINEATAFPLRRLMPGDPEIRLDYSLQAACDDTTDLTFYLGRENPTVRRYRHLYYHPLAFAQRVSYDVGQAWGRGFIWISANGQHSAGFPRWETPSTLKAMIMHELGHVLGCAHVVGTIMDANFVAIMKKSTLGTVEDVKRLRLDAIDRVRTLAVPVIHSTHELAELISATDVRVAGVFPSYDWSMQIIRGDLVMQTGRSVRIRAGAALTAFSGQTRLRIVRVVEIDRQRNDAPIFKMAFLRAGSVPSLTSLYSQTESITYMAAILPRDGTGEIPVTIRFNGDQYHMRIYAWGTDGRPELVLGM